MLLWNIFSTRVDLNRIVARFACMLKPLYAVMSYCCDVISWRPFESVMSFHQSHPCTMWCHFITAISVRWLFCLGWFYLLLMMLLLFKVRNILVFRSFFVCLRYNQMFNDADPAWPRLACILLQCHRGWGGDYLSLYIMRQCLTHCALFNRLECQNCVH